MKRFYVFLIFATSIVVGWSQVPVSGVYYILDNNALTAQVTSPSSQSATYYSGDLSIPSSITYGKKTYSVTSIGASAFKGSSKLTGITLPSSIENIGVYSFNNCVNLKTVTLADGLKKIEYGAFSNCSELTTISLPSTLLYIGDYAFENCSKLSTFSIPNACQYVGDGVLFNTAINDVVYSSNALVYVPPTYSGKQLTVRKGTRICGLACYNCTLLPKVDLPETIQEIGTLAFANCSTLNSINIPAGLKKIGGSAFYDCTALTSIELPDSIESIPEYAFIRTGLTSIKLPKLLRSIGYGAFKECGALKSVSFPKAMDSIDAYAFYNCRGITTLELPDSMSSIGIEAFSYCTSIKSIHLHGNPIFKTNAFNLVNADSLFISGELISSFATCMLNVKYLDLQGGNTINGSPSAWNGLQYLSVDGDFGIPYEWCKGMARLKTLIIGDKITSIRNDAFLNCTKLSEVHIGTNVEIIYNGAFSGCSSLSKIYIYSNKLKGIYDSSFANCGNILHVYIDDIRQWCNVNISRLANPVSLAQYSVTFGNAPANILHIPNDISVVKSEVFNSRLWKRIIVPECVISIGENNFVQLPNVRMLQTPGRFCQNFVTTTATSLDSVVITSGEASNFMQTPVSHLELYEGVSSVLDHAFMQTNIDTLALPSTVTKIENYAFAGCDKLAFIDLSNCESIGSYGFANDTNINTMSLSNVREIGSYAFTNSSVNDTIFATHTPSIIMHTGAFSNCQKLEDVTYKSTYDIDSLCFSNCTHLKTFITQDCPQYIRYGAFYNCSALESFQIKGDRGRLEGIETSSFENCTNLVNCPLNKTKIKNIAPRTFMKCQSLATFSWPDSVVNVNDHAFFGCTRLTLTAFPSSVQTIGHSAYSGCSSISMSELSKNITSISDSAFFGCVKLRIQNIPANIKSLGIATFMNCVRLDSVHFENSLKNIPESLFEGCSNLVKLVLPSSMLETIQKRAFSATGLKTIYCFSTSIPKIQDISAFDNQTYTNATLFVPCKYKTKFQTKWSFTNIEERIPAFVKASASSGGTIDKIMPTCEDSILWVHAYPKDGYSFKYWSDGDVRIDREIKVINDTNIIAYFGSEIKTTEWYDVPFTRTYSNAEIYSHAFYNSNFSFSSVGRNKKSQVNKGTYYYGDTTSVSQYDYYFYIPTQATDTIYLNIPNDGILRIAVKSFSSTGSHSISIGKHTIKIDVRDTIMNVGGKLRYVYPYQYLNLTKGTYMLVCSPENEGTLISSMAFRKPGAYFALQTNAQHGKVLGAGMYEEGSTVQITAIPDEHYHFVSWNDGTIDNPRKVIVASDTMFTALFEIDQCSIMVNCDSTRGTAIGSGKYNYGSNAQISVSPTQGYGFRNWYDGNTDNPRTIQVTSDSVFTALLLPEYIVNISCNQVQGSVSGGGKYLDGDTATIKATPNTHYHFESWSDGNTENPRTIRILQDTSLSAIFSINTYTLSVTYDSTMGTIVGMGNYAYGTKVKLQAIAKPKYKFTSWTDGSTYVYEDTLTITMNHDVALTATFVKNVFSIFTSVNDTTMGIVNPNGTFTQTLGSLLTITATPKSGYKFTQWNDENKENPREIIIDKDTSLMAYFDMLGLYNVTLLCNTSQGSVNGGGTYTEGSSATITATASSGYHFTKWSDNNTDNPRTITVTKDISLTAYFEADPKPTYTISLSCNTSQGSVSGGGTYIEGSSATITATAKSGYKFTKWSDNNTANPRTITITKDLSLTAYFEETDTPQPTTTFWNMSDTDFKNLGTITSNTTVRGLTIKANSSNSVVVDASSQSCDGISFTHRLKLGGSGNSSYRVVTFDVTGNCTIDIYAKSSTGGEDRNLSVVKGSFGGTSIGSASAPGSSVKKTSITYAGSATTIYVYSPSNGVNIYGIRVTTSGSKPDPRGDCKTLPYTETFTGSTHTFTIQNVVMDAALSSIWILDTSGKKYGIVANAMVNNVKYASESWLIAPCLEIPINNTCALTFDHAAKYFSNASEQMALYVSSDYEDGKPNTGTWSKLTIPTYPTGSNWNFVGSGNIDLSKYAGQSITLALKYTSSTSSVPQWEVKNFKVVAVPCTGVDEITFDITDEDVRFYTIMGYEVDRHSLSSGQIYIAVKSGQQQKIIMR